MKNKEGLEMEVCTDSKNAQQKDSKILDLKAKLKIQKITQAVVLAVSIIISNNSSANQNIDCKYFEENKKELIKAIKKYPIEYRKMQKDDMENIKEIELQCSRYEKNQKLLKKFKTETFVIKIDSMIDDLPEALDKISGKKYKQNINSENEEYFDYNTNPFDPTPWKK